MSRPPLDYVIFGTAPWSAPWLTEQNLAHALAKRHRVLYVEPRLTPLSPFRYGRGSGVRSNLARALARRVRYEDGVAIYQPLVLPPRSHPLAAALSAPILAAQVARVCGKLGFERPVMVTGEDAPGIIGAAGECLSVYLVKDWVEDAGHLLGRDSSHLAAGRDAMCAGADLVCAISPQLQDTLASKGIKASLLRHGFHADLSPCYDAPEPPEYEGLPRPLLGFAGRIDARLDFDLLARLAEHFHHGSIVLIGPVSPRLDQSALDRLRERPNVHVLGPYGRTELPAYLTHLDCALIPYVESEWGRHGSPLKLWDYLYAGPPVVGSGYSILRDYHPDLVRFAESRREFVNAVERALADPASARGHRRAFASANTWDTRAEELDETVKAELTARSGDRTRVAVFPFAPLANPYQRLLYDALEPHGVEVLAARPMRLRWALRGKRSADVVHIHWSEWLISDSKERSIRGLLKACGRSARLLLALAALRRGGGRVVWTVHNLRAHEPCFPRLESGVNRVLAKLADALVVHSEYAAGKVRQELRPRAPIHVATHGNYVSAYPVETRSKEEIRVALGLPEEAFVYLLFGHIRPYKQIPAVIEAFAEVPDPDSRLLIAGAVHESQAELLKVAADKDDRVELRLGVVPDEDVATYHLASDAAILNYRDVFSSGALLLALSFGLPVVAPHGSTADEIASPSAVTTFPAGGLTAALRQVRSGEAALKRAAAAADADRYPWSRTALELLPAYGVTPVGPDARLGQAPAFFLRSATGLENDAARRH